MAAVAVLVATAVVANGSSQAEDTVKGESVVALIGDSPYSDGQESAYRDTYIDEISGAASVAQVYHVGDTKAGGDCSDSWYAETRDLYNQFADPFILTPGDNDWTDCHRADNGSHVPTERLGAMRDAFYATPGQTMGQRPLAVSYQESHPENIRTRVQGVLVATVHVTGSQNGLSPWDVPDPEGSQQKEFDSRMEANVDWIGDAFLRANNENAPGVMLVMQAEPTTGSAFLPIRNEIKDQAEAFGKPVLLVHGDEHKYEAEPGFAGVENLTRLEVCGNQATEWLELSINTNDGAELFSWQRHNPHATCPGAD
ncbi:MAG: metallophosphoesterase [Stackebrandtia sp.]